MVFRHPLLAALDARARAELESAGEVRALRAGESLFRAGDPADALFVVTSGEIALRSGARTAELRRARAGDAVGEESVARAHATRRHDASAATDAEIALLPSALLRRVMARGESSDAGARTRRWLLRALASDALERSAFSGDLPAREREIMLDAGRAIELRRGDVLHREGDPSSEAYFLAEGIVRVAGGGGVLAYHKAGDFFGDEAIEDEVRDATATATSEAWIFAVRAEVVREVAARHPDALGRALRVQTAARARQREIRENATRHVLDDLHRFETSRSLLAIDQERCIRCGACAWSCGATHDDGVSRLLRRGDVVVAKVSGRAKTLLLPSSCQHCKNPACMIDCPTGAITRDARGEVQIREELCTGCGSCAKACPWDNIQMAPRGRRLPLVTASDAVAVKCDLCHDRNGAEAACVAACPAEAIERIDPSVALDEVAAVLERRPRAEAGKRAFPISAIVGGAAAAGAGAALSGTALSRSASGVLLLMLILGLFSYAGVKRLGVRVRGRAARVFVVRPHFVVHLGLGAASFGVAIAHAGGTSALAVAFWACAILGALAGTLGKLVPPRLARIERKALLPEEIAEQLALLDARVFRDLTGRSDLLKGLYARVLRPFSSSPFVLASICARGTSQRALRDRLGERIRGLVGEADERLAGLDGLVASTAERQALRAQRLLDALLRGASFAHVVLAAALAVLVAIHVFVEVTR
ncbi:MAG TPA: cyclic nucleotide-binding domain-containing protein [Polyangiaceae bacterium]